MFFRDVADRVKDALRRWIPKSIVDITAAVGASATPDVFAHALAHVLLSSHNVKIHFTNQSLPLRDYISGKISFFFW